VGLATAGPPEAGWRKVRAGQGTVVANSHPGRPAGKCHRKYTAKPALTLWVQACKQESECR